MVRTAFLCPMKKPRSGLCRGRLGIYWVLTEVLLTSGFRVSLGTEI